MGGGVETPLAFAGQGGVPLQGTLTRPDRAGDTPVGAVLLIQGSGPTDRDGNQPPHLRTDLLRQLAHRLADSGIASLRVDKRGMHANAASLPRDPAGLESFFTWEAALGDAAAALRALAEQPGLSPGRFGIVGHSEGGMIALEVARRGMAEPRALVLLATPGRNAGTIIEEQLDAIMRRQGLADGVRAAVLADDRRIRDTIAETGRVPGDVPPGLRALYPPYIGPFLQDQLRLDPAAAAAGVPMPVLVVTGRSDMQVSADRDAVAYAATLKERTDGSAVETPEGVSHNLKAAAAGEPGIDGTVAEPVLAILLPWLGQRLGN